MFAQCTMQQAKRCNFEISACLHCWCRLNWRTTHISHERLNGKYVSVSDAHRTMSNTHTRAHSRASNWRGKSEIFTYVNVYVMRVYLVSVCANIVQIRGRYRRHSDLISLSHFRGDKTARVKSQAEERKAFEKWKSFNSMPCTLRTYSVCTNTNFRCNTIHCKPAHGWTFVQCKLSKFNLDFFLGKPLLLLLVCVSVYLAICAKALIGPIHLIADISHQSLFFSFYCWFTIDVTANCQPSSRSSFLCDALHLA